MSDGKTATASPNPSGRTLPWRDLRWISSGVLLSFLAFVLWGLFGPEPPIVVSRATTFVTEPLAADGLPDYSAAVVAAYGPRPPPEENAAVPLVVMHRDLMERPAMVPIILGWLGRELPAAGQDDGPALRPEDVTCIIRELIEDPFVPSVADVRDHLVEAAIAKPEVAAAIGRSAAALDGLVEVSRLPGYWCPGVAWIATPPGHTGPRLPRLDSAVEDAVEQGAVLLLCRAAWHARGGRFPEAWQDLLAMHRLARLMAAVRPARSLASLRIAAFASDGAKRLLTLPGLPAAERAIIRRDLDALPPLVDCGGWLTLHRLEDLERIVWMARRCPTGRSGRGAAWPWVGKPPWLFMSLDWNVVLRRVNERLDEGEAVASLPLAADRQAAWGQMESDWPTARPPQGWRAVASPIAYAVSREARSVFVADEFLKQYFFERPRDADEHLVRAREAFAQARAAASDFRGRHQVR
ncbi:MAG: hypothetical protein WCC69_14555 [Pirellulales bacterium]